MVEQHQIIEEETFEIGKISLAIYKDFFSYSYGGVASVFLIFALHIIINCCSIAVSLYLAFTLTHRFNDTDEFDEPDSNYNFILIAIIVVSLLSSFLGKLISIRLFMRIYNRLHDETVRKVL